MKEEAFKAKVKSKVRNAALKNKMDNIKYGKLLLQEYLNSPLFDSESFRMLMALAQELLGVSKVTLEECFQTVP